MLKHSSLLEINLLFMKAVEHPLLAIKRGLVMSSLFWNHFTWWIRLLHIASFCLRTWYKEASSQRKTQLAAISPLMSLPSLPKWRERDMFNAFLYMHANTSFSYAQWPMHRKWCFFKHSLKCPSEGLDYYPNHCFMASACWRPVRLTYCNEFNGIRGTGGES